MTIIQAGKTFEMYRDLKMIALIPARKNSKGIKNKNLRTIGGKSLVELSILQALETKVFDLIVVSSDSEQILRLAKKHNVLSSGLRPENYSSDSSKIIDVVKYEFNRFNFIKFDCLVLLQPTSPLRTSKDIKNALDLYIDSGTSSVLSVCESVEKPHLIRLVDTGGSLLKVVDIDSDLRRQDSPKLYKVNGAIYVNNTKDFMKDNLVFNDNQMAYVMTQETSVDIDNFDDLFLARKVYRQIRRKI